MFNALVGNARGYRSVIVIPDTQSEEKKDMLRLCGADLRQVPAVPFKNPNHFVHTSQRIAEELEWLGLRDMLAEPALLLVEWPERGNGILPQADLTITLGYSGSGRMAHLVPATEAGKQLVIGLEND